MGISCLLIFLVFDNADAEIDGVTHIENILYFENNIFEGYSKVDYSIGKLFCIVQIRKSKPK